jgi:uncharacterized iron-regulated membrane protein
MLDINWNPSRRELRQFGGIWLPAFAAFAGTVIYRSGKVTTALVIWSVAALVAGIAVAWPQRLKPLFVGWMAAAYPIGWTVSHIVLGAVYFVLFTFVGLFMRIFRYDPLERTGGRTTYWKPRPDRTEPAAYFRQF